VFIYPFVILTNDLTPPSNYLIGGKLGNFFQIVTTAVILPGSEFGENRLLVSNSTVS